MSNDNKPNPWQAIAFLFVISILAASGYLSAISGATLETSFDVVVGMVLITIAVVFMRWLGNVSLFACGWLLSFCSLIATWRVIRSAMVNNAAFEAHWYTSSYAILTGFGLLIMALYLRHK